MNKNILEKAKFIVGYIKKYDRVKTMKAKDLFEGYKILDMGSEDVNWGESLHNNIQRYMDTKIIRVDKFGSPDVKADFNKDLPFKDKSVDCILCFEVIEHLENPLGFMRECHRILKDGGEILLTTPNAGGLAEFRSAQVKRHHSKVYDEHLYNWHSVNMLHFMSRLKWKSFDIETLGFYWDRNFLFRFLAKIFPPLNANLFVRAVK